MRLKTDIASKRGSYIVEAAVTLPVFLIAVIVMLSIIMMYAGIEEANYILANEMRREALQANYFDGSMLFASMTGRKIMRQVDEINDLTINNYLYREDYFQIDEAILLNYDIHFHTRNPLGLASDASYELALMTRAYVGKYRDIDPMSDEDLAGDDAEPVYVFPKMGEKYHGKSCTYVRAAYTSGPLSSAIRAQYAPCSVCHSDRAAPGSVVYYFPEYGDSYHRKGCRALSRHYIEMERSVAEERGYTPCSKCGGH